MFYALNESLGLLLCTSNIIWHVLQNAFFRYVFPFHVLVTPSKKAMCFECIKMFIDQAFYTLITKFLSKVTLSSVEGDNKEQLFQRKQYPNLYGF